MRPAAWMVGSWLVLATSMASAQSGGEVPEERATKPDRASPDETLAPDQIVTGIVTPGTEEGDGAREVGNVALWLPRNIIDYTFRGTAAAARFVADEQLVPRYRQWVGAPLDGNFFVFPTLFADTGSTFSVGARMITDSPRVTTSQRFAFGGPRDLVTESRVLFKGGLGLPLALSLESYYEIESTKTYHGIGIRPITDPRNRFVPGNPNSDAEYLEQHTRGIVALGARLDPNFELFLSSSVYRRQIDDSPDSDKTLNEVFVPGSVVGTNVPGRPSAGHDTWITYAEIAARFDNREFRGRPATGVLLEGYLGHGQSFQGEPVNYARHGWRAAGFIPIYRRTNILSPRLVFDRLIPLGNTPVPFYELPRQPDFRGFDTRRDFISMVASIDYTWQLVSFMSMRAFVDGATVAPELDEITLDQLRHMRFAGGLGFDFYNRTAILGRIA
ncbi:MAG TPA: hypothetical protein ENK57_23670, partial [Polyangiaceae bacterium]|nr:hypothetical protein [Polyangiaceae bacterium]